MLEKSGKKQKSKIWRELYNGLTNYRMYGLAACYAYTFGVEASHGAISKHPLQLWIDPIRPWLS